MNRSRKVFVESIREPIQIDNKSGKTILKGIFLQADVVNGNGRLYPLSVLQESVENYRQEKIGHGNAVGELGHNDTDDIQLDRVSHKILKLEQDGHNFIGTAEILENMPMGKIAKSLVESGITLGFSSRAFGESVVDGEGIEIIGPYLYMQSAADIVASPSAPEAWAEVMMESRDWIFEEHTGWVKKKLHQKEKFNEKEMLKLFNKFLEKEL